MEAQTQTVQGSGGNPGANPSGGGGLLNIKAQLPSMGLGSAPTQEAPEGQTQQAEGQEGETPAKVWAGRYKTPEELEAEHTKLMIRYDESSRHGRSLAQAIKDMEAEKIRWGSEVETLREQLKSAVPAFKELAPEELIRLKTEEPGKYVDYILAKERNDRDVAERKSKEEAKVKSVAEKRKAVEDAQRKFFIEVQATPERFPMFQELIPAMDEILDLAPQLGGHENTPELTYMIALGAAYLNSMKGSRQLSSQEREKAAGMANGAAAHVGSTSPSAKGGGNGMDDLNNRIVKAGPKSFFKT